MTLLGGETFTSYIKDVLRLCHRTSLTIPEDEEVTPLTKGVAENAFRPHVTDLLLGYAEQSPCIQTRD